MKRPMLMLTLAVLAGCGVDTATTAATGAAIKQQEADAGRKNLEQAQQRVEQAAQQMQERAARDGEAAGR